MVLQTPPPKLWGRPSLNDQFPPPGAEGLSRSGFTSPEEGGGQGTFSLRTPH